MISFGIPKSFNPFSPFEGLLGID